MDIMKTLTPETETIESPLRNEFRVTIIPNEAIIDERLTKQTKLVYVALMYLAQHMGRYSVRKLRKLARMDFDEVVAALRQLDKYGYIDLGGKS